MTAPVPPHNIYSLMPASFPWAFIALVGLAIIVFFVWLYRRKPRSAHPEVAIQRDYVAETRALILRLRPPHDAFPLGKVQEEYFFALSIALRKLIFYRHQINAVGATVRELDRRLLALPLPEQTINEILAFMRRADQVKFAKQPSDLAQAQADYTQVVSWTKMLTATGDSDKQKNG